MTEVVIALLMIINNEIVEARIQDNLSSCLKGKRIAMRESVERVQYKCIKSKAELETNIDGSITIKKLILQ
jgi:hypothetical protein